MRFLHDYGLSHFQACMQARTSCWIALSCKVLLPRISTKRSKERGIMAEGRQTRQRKSSDGLAGNKTCPQPVQEESYWNTCRYWQESYPSGEDIIECCSVKMKIYTGIGIFQKVAHCDRCDTYRYKVDGKWVERK